MQLSAATGSCFIVSESNEANLTQRMIKMGSQVCYTPSIQHV